MMVDAGSIRAMVAIKATASSTFVANLETDVAIKARYSPQMLNEWLKLALDASGISQAELGRRLSSMLGRSIDRAAVNKMVKDERAMAADEMFAISAITKFPPPEPPSDMARLIHVLGLVGAGSAMILYSENDALDDWVPAPDNATDKTVALEIRGDSLGAIFNGWVLFYDDRRAPVTENLIGRLCVAELADGRVLVKQIKAGAGPGLFTLFSNFEPPIYDVALRWAAEVKDIRPRR